MTRPPDDAPAPPRRLVVPFTKMNGAGNDFVVIDNRWFHFTPDELGALAARVCRRRVGVGADGLLALEAGADGAHFRMRYRNADGSLGTMCGNGARCLARFAARAGLGDTDGDATTLVFDTDGGRYRASVPAEGDVTLDVPPPRAWARAAVDGETDLWRIWTGTEHAVRFVPDVAAEDVDTFGRRLRHDAAFAPAGTNVNFVEVRSPDAVVARTFEKGVEAETLACGTGAVASALAARLAGRLASDRVAVHMPGGTLHVGFRLNGEEVTDVTLAGPAETVYEGTLEL